MVSLIKRVAGTLLPLLLGAVLHGQAQQLPPNQLCDEDFKNPPTGYYWQGQNTNVKAELTPEGYTLRFFSMNKSLNSQNINPPGPRLNMAQDFVLETELRGKGLVGFYWGGHTFVSGNDFYLFQMKLPTAGSTDAPGFEIWQLRHDATQRWTKLFSGALPGPAGPADWHSIRVVRAGNNVHYWLDGTRVWQQAWPNPTGHNVGLAVQNNGAEVTARRLRIWHYHDIKLAADLPPNLKREKLSAAVNTDDRNELTPLVSANGRWLYFSRVMGDPKAVDEALKFNSDTYVSERQADGSWGPAKALGFPVNNEVSNFPQHVSPDGQSLLMNGRYTPEGKGGGKGHSWTHLQADGTWTMPQLLDLDNSTQPKFGNRNASACIDASGTVLLHSNVLATDLHNADIYIRRLGPDGRWSSSVPLPAPINTPGDEATPFLAPDGKTLYFSSNTHPGYGGYDVFVSRRLDDTWMKWSEPLNLGPALNTRKGEINFSTTASGEYAYFSSADEQGKSDDIYRLKLPTSLRPQATVLVRGRVLDARTNEPVVAAQVRYEVLASGAQPAAVPIAGNGTYEIALPAGQQYSFRAEAAGYFAAADNLDLDQTTAFGEVSRDLFLLPVAADVAPLAAAPVRLTAGAALPKPAVPAKVASVAVAAAPKPTEERLVLNNVFFEQGKPALLPSSFPELKRLAQTLKDNPTLRIRLEGHTDSQGDAQKNQLLSEQRVAEIKKYLIRQEVAANRLDTVGYGPSRPVAANDTEDHRRQNRRVEFTVLSR